MSYNENDRLQVRRVVEDWALFRDSGDWESFASVWHEDGWMSATWFQGNAIDFIEASRKAFESGGRLLHFLGGHTSCGRENRAVAQTKMTITQRAEVHGVTVDVICTGRFYDFLERRGGRWGIVRRQPIYETDRLAPVDPAVSLSLDHLRLADSVDPRWTCSTPKASSGLQARQSLA